jgi:hypothetical protein
MGMMSGWICGLIVICPLAARAQVDLTSLDHDMVGQPTQVLVLGTVHLRNLEGFRPSSLDGILDRLAAFKPDIITIEARSGEQCDMAARHPAKYGPDYCSDTDAAKAATTLDVPAAIAEVATTLSAWPAKPTASERRHLAALFLAAHDPASAYVQWLRLDDDERRAGDGLDSTLVAMLRGLEARKNEDIQIGARLAARLNLQRLYPIDDHTGDAVVVADGKAFGRAVQEAWNTGAMALDDMWKEEEVLSQADDLVPLYRYINDQQYLRRHSEMNVGAPMRAKSPEGYPRIWVAGWEVRNLRMIANIQETFRDRPGVRVLSIVGAGHKPWFDSWLGQLQGVEIVDVDRVLR